MMSKDERRPQKTGRPLLGVAIAAVSSIILIVVIGLSFKVMHELPNKGEFTPGAPAQQATSKDEDLPPHDAKLKSLPLGASPLGEGKFSESERPFLKLINKSGKDVLVKMVNQSSGDCIRNFYVTADNEYRATHIPPGVYVFYSAFGLGWNDVDKGFKYVRSFQKTEPISFDVTPVYKTENGEVQTYNQYNDHTVLLQRTDKPSEYPSNQATFSAGTITENQFYGKK
jgi:hypothetical protein